MKYRLGDICTITKGETGIMKAIPGPYTMIALGETDKTHNEFQFDTKAVIIPLVSSTGHGHASMKRVKYCEGKFALGNILCAVVPNDENFVLAKYLHIYLHWNREELLVSQMKGMANVSLPMIRIADVMVTVPSIEKQREIIELEKKLVEKEIEADKLFADQLTQLENLNQAILQEAFQGKLVEPSKNEILDKEHFLKLIENEKSELTSKRKYKPLIASEKNEIKTLCYNIPKNWQWFRLGEVAFFQEGPGIRVWQFTKSGIKLLNVQNILKDDTVDYLNSDKYVSEQEFNEKYKHFQIENGDILWASSGASWGKLAWHKDPGFSIMLNTSTIRLKFFSKELFDPYLFYFLKTEFFKIQMIPQLMGMQPNFGATHLSRTYIPIPPLSEQKRIVAEIEKQLAKTKQLKEHIIANQQATEQLLKALLHQAFEVREKDLA